MPQRARWGEAIRGEIVVGAFTGVPPKAKASKLITALFPTRPDQTSQLGHTQAKEQLGL